MPRSSIGSALNASFVLSLQPRVISQSHFPARRISSTTLRATVEYHWIDGVERPQLYERGGYHPIIVGDVLHDRYRIVDKLGFGGYSTIWLAHDRQSKRYVAIKVGISSSPKPRREPRILRVLHTKSLSQSVETSTNPQAGCLIPQIWDEFDIQGPNGTHTCYTVAPTQGDLRTASFSRLFPIRVARALAANLVTAVAFVHSRGIVHGGSSARPNEHMKLILI